MVVHLNTKSKQILHQPIQGYQSRTSEQALIGIGDGNIEISEGQTTGSEKITVNQGAVDNALPGV